MDHNEIQQDIESTGNATSSPPQTHFHRDIEEPIWSQPLLDALEKDNFEDIQEIIKKHPEAVYGGGSLFKQVPFVVAVQKNLDTYNIEYLINMMSADKLSRYVEQICAANEACALHVAVYKNNFAAAKVLVCEIPGMLNCHDEYNQTPLHLALRRGNTKMAFDLLKVISAHYIDLNTLMTYAAGIETLKYAVTIRMYDFASVLVEKCPKLATDASLWKLLIEKCEDFPCRSQMNMFQSKLYSWTPIDTTIDSMTPSPVRRKNRRSPLYEDRRLFSNQISQVIRWKKLAQRVLVPKFQKQARKVLRIFDRNIHSMKLKHHQAIRLTGILCEQIRILRNTNRSDDENRNPNRSDDGNHNPNRSDDENRNPNRSDDGNPDPNRSDDGSQNPTAHSKDGNSKRSVDVDVRRVFNSAVQNGISDIVTIVLGVFPEAITYTDDDDINALQIAASHRYGRTFDVLYKHCKWNNNEDLPLSVDTDGNNILHLVAQKARRNRVGTGSGEVLQLQREFRWYKEIEKLLSDLKFKKNNAKKVPLEVFDEDHREMLKSEGQWMTSMSNSCMVAGSLIATVMFAAAITLPGGNNDDGPPNFSKRLSFKIFAFSDAFALISSLTVVVTFLSIFTTRYSVESFQYDLPRRMIIGLISLLLSVTFLMTAFCATVHLLLTEGYKWIIYPAVPVSFIPVFFFTYLQVPSLVNIVKSTYGRDIFKDDIVMRASNN